MNFISGSSLSLDPIEPEQLKVKFTRSLTSNLFNVLEKGTVIYMTIPQQLDAGELLQLEQFAEGIKKPVVYFSALQLAINLGVGAGLKHMWKVINVLQFVVFFLLWQINVPQNASDFIDQVRNLAFFEFLTDWVFDLFKPEENECELSTEVDCFYDESKVGEKRLGSSNFLKNAGFMALAGLGLVVTLIVLGVLVVAGKKSERAIKVYNLIKRELFWNGLIRYIL